MQNRADKSQGLTRPEIAVLNAYAKLNLFNELVDTDIANDKYYDQTLQNYSHRIARVWEVDEKSPSAQRNYFLASLQPNDLILADRYLWSA